jgi:gamma-glutamyl-gamma-aminobutyrate hydrolase PuuD
VRPLVAVTGRPTKPGRPWRLAGVGSQLNYLDAVARAGGLGVVLAPITGEGTQAAADTESAGPDDESAADSRADALRVAAGEALDHFDGLLLGGGPDLDPVLYGQEPHETVYGNNRAVDRFEIALCHAALRARLPVLAICRGLQVVNVACGGTLHQHISDRPGGSDHGRPGVSGARTVVTLQPGSRVAAVVGGDTIKASCFHHQAVDRVGAGLVATGWADDGVVEALEPAGAHERPLVEALEPARPGEEPLPGGTPPAPPAGSWLLAVQWHPETVAADEPDQQAIFDAFHAAAATYRA